MLISDLLKGSPKKKINMHSLCIYIYIHVLITYICIHIAQGTQKTQVIFVTFSIAPMTKVLRVFAQRPVGARAASELSPGSVQNRKNGTWEWFGTEFNMKI